MITSRADGRARWWRRRFLVVALIVSVGWIGFGVVFGVIGRDHDQRDGGGPSPIVPAVVGAALLATFVAYRRLAGPVAELLDGAERIGGGDYRTRVSPSGPRAVRTLGQSFNEMAARLDASEESRRRFLADVSHELRTPLTVLRAGVEAQLDGIHPRDDGHLETLLDQTRTLDRLVEDLRTLALGDAGRLALHPEALSIAVLVVDSVAAIAPSATRRGITLATELGPDVDLEADPVRLRQVLGNLLSNALRHTAANGHVTVTTERNDRRVYIVVSDDGPGITGDPERLFERFASSADSGGSGLGLTIARQLVEAHGGTLSAANAASGGARFTISLPLPAGEQR